MSIETVRSIMCDDCFTWMEAPRCEMTRTQLRKLAGQKGWLRLGRRQSGGRYKTVDLCPTCVTKALSGPRKPERRTAGA